jgi:hypothetical protein
MNNITQLRLKHSVDLAMVEGKQPLMEHLVPGLLVTPTHGWHYFFIAYGDE